MLITEKTGQKSHDFLVRRELGLYDKPLEKPTKQDSLGELGCLKFPLDFLGEEQQINTCLSERLKGLSQGESKQIDLIGTSLILDSCRYSKGRYLPTGTTLLINYRISQTDKKLSLPTWKIERFLGEGKSVSSQGTPQDNQELLKKSWQDWMQNLSRAKTPGKCIFSNYCSIEVNPGIFLAVALYSFSEKSPQIPQNCYGCRYFYGEEHNDNFVVCGFHHRGQENCRQFKPLTAKRLLVSKRKRD